MFPHNVSFDPTLQSLSLRWSECRPLHFCTNPNTFPLQQKQSGESQDLKDLQCLADVFPFLDVLHILLCFYFLQSFQSLCVSSVQSMPNKKTQFQDCKEKCLHINFNKWTSTVLFSFWCKWQLFIEPMQSRATYQVLTKCITKINTLIAFENLISGGTGTGCRCVAVIIGHCDMCPPLTVFMSMVMFVCEEVWLSDVEQEFTEDGSWTRPVCCKFKRDEQIFSHKKLQPSWSHHKAVYR